MSEKRNDCMDIKTKKFSHISQKIFEDIRLYLIFMKLNNQNANIEIINKIYKDIEQFSVQCKDMEFTDLSILSNLAENLLSNMKNNSDYVNESSVFTLLYIIDIVYDELKDIEQNEYSNGSCRNKIKNLILNICEQKDENGNFLEIFTYMGINDIKEIIKNINYFDNLNIPLYEILFMKPDPKLPDSPKQQNKPEPSINNKNNSEYKNIMKLLGELSAISSIISNDKAIRNGDLSHLKEASDKLDYIARELIIEVSKLTR